MCNKVIDHENINGVMLSLDIISRKSSPKSVGFTISFKTAKKRSRWSKTSLFIAVLFNIFALCYVHISLFAILMIIFTLSFLLFFWITHSVQSETMLVIPTVGIQISTKYICSKDLCFIPWTGVDDVIINEVIQLNRVIYYLTVLVKEADDSIKLVPVFKCTRPRLRMLEAIYCEMQTLLKDSVHFSEDTPGGGDTG